MSEQEQRRRDAEAAAALVEAPRQWHVPPAPPMASERPLRRVVELRRLPGADDPAPEGYEWATLGQALPTISGSPALVLMCMTCTALVGIPEAHTAWHEYVRSTK